MSRENIILILIVGLIIVSFGYGLVMFDAPDRAVSMYGPVSESTIPSDSNIVQYSNLDETEQNEFREHKNAIIKSRVSEQIVINNGNLYEGVDSVVVDGDYYVVNEETPSIFEQAPYLITGLISSVILFSIMYLLLFDAPLANYLVRMFGYDSIPRLKVVVFATIGIVILAAAGFTVMEAPPNSYTGIEQVESTEDTHTVPFSELTQDEQQEFLSLISGDVRQLDEHWSVLSSSSVTTIEYNGELYEVTQTPPDGGSYIMHIMYGSLIGVLLSLPLIATLAGIEIIEENR